MNFATMLRSWSCPALVDTSPLEVEDFTMAGKSVGAHRGVSLTEACAALPAREPLRYLNLASF
jgi:hypothetical protein